MLSTKRERIPGGRTSGEYEPEAIADAGVWAAANRGIAADAATTPSRASADGE